MARGGAGAHRGAAAAGGAGAGVPRGGRLGHGEGGQASLALGNVAPQLLSPRLVGGQYGLAIG